MKTKEEKREEAEKRQEEYNSLSKDKKLERVKSRRGKSLKEKKRLKRV